MLFEIFMQNILHCDFYIFIVNGDTGQTLLTKSCAGLLILVRSTGFALSEGKNPRFGTLPEPKLDSVSSLGRYHTTQN